MKKEVLVETVDSRMFQAVMTIVVKNKSGEYGIFLKDLCKILSLNINSVNKYLTDMYSYNKSQQIPHLEFAAVNINDEYYYVQGGEKYELSDTDVFYIANNDMGALPYALLDIISEPSINTNFEEKFAVVLNMTVNDCFKYASKFEFKK